MIKRLSDKFIKATEEYNDFEKNVPAPYFRRSFEGKEGEKLKLTVMARGFYELYFNKERITRGLISPYVSNPDCIVYGDEYTVECDEGENVIGVILGNGFQNDPGGYIWDFDKADFRSAPSFALAAERENGEVIFSDESFKTAPSPILSDDYRFGEYYDGGKEIAGWNQKGFDCSDWKPALRADVPKGELRIADVPPITCSSERLAQRITKLPDGSYIYDFSVSGAGLCRLSVKDAFKGQKIELRYADALDENGDVDLGQIWFPRDRWEYDKKIVHRDVYLCKGEKAEEYTPSFTYHGFRYVKVSGISPEQATKELLTCLEYHTELSSKGDFSCSDERACRLQEITRRSILSNFHHFPTDCPQREKNGWTADAALSAEATLLNFDPERSYREWMRNICKAQKEDGSLPGIVPTAGWGFEWGNGPAWDCVLLYLPYFTYIYRGSTDIFRESAAAVTAYLKYLRSRCDERGLLEIGLGDWCHVGNIPPKAPLIFTDSVIAMDVASKAKELFCAIGDEKGAELAGREAEAYRKAIREYLIDPERALVTGECQSCQAMALYYGVFEPEQESAAFERLLEMIHEKDDHIDTGVLGGRVIFHVLSKFGCGELAYKMIMRPDYPSYGNWLERGATTLWEIFAEDYGSWSQNHHFWGDVSAWFIKRVVGICLNPTHHDISKVDLRPDFIGALQWAQGYHESPKGKIWVRWERSPKGCELSVEIPEGITAMGYAPKGWHFENGSTEAMLKTGKYKMQK